MIAEATAPRKTKRTISPAIRAYLEASAYIVSPNSCEGQDWQVIKQDGTFYVVDLAGPRCSCMDFAKRGAERPCKHVELVRLHVAADAPAPAPPAAPARRTFSDAEKAALLSLWD